MAMYYNQLQGRKYDQFLFRSCDINVRSYQRVVKQVVGLAEIGVRGGAVLYYQGILTDTAEDWSL